MVVVEAWTFMGATLKHNVLPWYEWKKPARNHRCREHTHLCLWRQGPNVVCVSRCVCGAYQSAPTGQAVFSNWANAGDIHVGD